MLDVKNEIKKLVNEEIPGNMNGRLSEFAVLLDTYNSNMNKIGRTQYKYSAQMDEIMLMLDDMEKDGRIINDYRKNTENLQKESSNLMSVLIKASDLLEDAYRYAQKSGQNAWEKQLANQWTSLGEYLASAGISRIDTCDVMFNMEIHRAVQTMHSPGSADGIILSMIRCGYIFRGSIVRKADVVVNRTDNLDTAEKKKNQKKIKRGSYNDSRDRLGHFNIGNRVFKRRKHGSYRKP